MNFTKNLTCNTFFFVKLEDLYAHLFLFSAFKDYLNGKCPAEQYHSICRLVTEGFQDVSLEIQSVEKDMSNRVIARMIRDLQEAEKQKLHEVNIQ